MAFWAEGIAEAMRRTNRMSLSSPGSRPLAVASCRMRKEAKGSQTNRQSESRASLFLRGIVDLSKSSPSSAACSGEGSSDLARVPARTSATQGR